MSNKSNYTEDFGVVVYYQINELAEVVAEVLEDMICAAQHDGNNSKGFLGIIPFGRKIYRPVDGIENLWFSNLRTTNCLSDMGQDACCLNIPVKLMNSNSDPGDYYDSQGRYLGNDGVGDNKVYQLKSRYRARLENKDVNWGGTLDEKYVNEIKQRSDDLGTVKETKMVFRGTANEKNLKQADGQLYIIQVVIDGNEFRRASFDAIGGPWGNGSPENGNYLTNTLLDRGPTGWYNTGMTKDGVGFSLNLEPQFKTGRKLLRIHPDGGSYFGTQGCIGLTCGKDGLLEFKEIIEKVLSKQKNIPLNVNIINNPNNDGYGKKAESNGE